jgi:RNA polymerase sigma-70 factor (ECF subfamily)
VSSYVSRLDALVADLDPVRHAQVGGVEAPEARRIYAEIAREPVRMHPRRLVLAASLVLVVLAAAATGLLIGSHGPASASAATVLEKAAAVARVQPLVVAQPGQFVYTKSQYTGLDTYADNGTTYAALIPWARESWIGPTGGRIHQVAGRPAFVDDRDRTKWIAAGSPSLTGPSNDQTDPVPPTKPLALPADPDALFTELRKQAAGFGPRLDAEMFVLVGDALRETNASPAQRAALYAVAARIPGVQLLGRVQSSGRAGIAVAIDDVVNHTRSTLVFDPATSQLLAEEETTLNGNSFGYRAGTKIFSIVYLQSAIVDALGARPTP